MSVKLVSKRIAFASSNTHFGNLLRIARYSVASIARMTAFARVTCSLISAVTIVSA